MEERENRREAAAALRVCYVGYVVQAAAVNLMPLLFGVFQQQFGLSYAMLSALVFVSFGVQILTDFLAVCFSKQLESRRTVVVAHGCCALGLILLGVLPMQMDQPFWGMVAAACVYSTGCGLIGVTVGALTDALPHPSGKAVLSLLHSFYCWGQVAVIALSTLLLRVFGEENWFVLPILWSMLPLWNMICFSKVRLQGVDLQESSGPGVLLASRASVSPDSGADGLCRCVRNGDVAVVVAVCGRRARPCQKYSAIFSARVYLPLAWGPGVFGTAFFPRKSRCAVR